MVSDRKLSTKSGVPKLTSDPIGQFITRMAALRKSEEKLARLLEQTEPDPSVVYGPPATDQAPEGVRASNKAIYKLVGLASLTLILVVLLT